MKKFYFTYGTEGQPFRGGWTEVIAPNYKSAVATFRACHPDKLDGIVNCSSIYTESEFAETTMSQKGNFGKRCQERITVTCESVNEDA